MGLSEIAGEPMEKKVKKMIGACLTFAAVFVFIHVAMKIMGKAAQIVNNLIHPQADKEKEN